MEKFFDKLKDKSVGLIALCVGVLFSFIFMVCEMIETGFSFANFLLIALNVFIYVQIALAVWKGKKGLATMWLFVVFGTIVYNFFNSFTFLEAVIEDVSWYDGAYVAFVVFMFFANLFAFGMAVLTVLNQYGIKFPYEKMIVGLVILGAALMFFVTAILCFVVDQWYLAFNYIATIAYFVILYAVIDLLYGETPKTEKAVETAPVEAPEETATEETATTETTETIVEETPVETETEENKAE